MGTQITLVNPMDVFRDEQQKPKTNKRFHYKEQYNLADERLARDESIKIFKGESLTEQHHTNDVNINVMMERMGVTDKSVIPAVAIRENFVEDFTGVVDLKTAMDRVIEANEQFMRLPAATRRHFQNDPARMYEFLTNPENTEEAEKMGFFANGRKPTEELPKTPPTPTPPANEGGVT